MIVPVSLPGRAYDIHITPSALQELPALPAAALPGEIALICNDRVGALYGDELARNLEKRGQKVTRFDIGDGEKSKSLETASRAYDVLARAKFSRRGAVWALGGGVTGDLAGYVAATWMRGVSFVQIPTSLLAMVDSSVGGKVGVNHPSAKNLIGAFWQPCAVICDPDCLQTLPPREIRAGLAEVIKYGVIADADFFDFLEKNLDEALDLNREVMSHIIARSCEIKAEVVGEDERESDAIGRRAILNYGHNVGHAFEAISGYGELLHGEAIALGMTIEARLAIALGTLDKSEGKTLSLRQSALFERAGLPIQTPENTDFEALWSAMALDKKNRGASVNFVLPQRLGHVVRVENVSKEAVREAVFSQK